MNQSKREPFARATKHPTLDTWIVADVAGNNLCWSDGSQSWEKWDAEARANAVNAAFNARVDEEERKAVEEFRERVKWYLRSTPLEHPGRADLTMDQAIKIIENIPTEPERGRE